MESVAPAPGAGVRTYPPIGVGGQARTDTTSRPWDCEYVSHQSSRERHGSRVRIRVGHQSIATRAIPNLSFLRLRRLRSAALIAPALEHGVCLGVQGQVPRLARLGRRGVNGEQGETKAYIGPVQSPEFAPAQPSVNAARRSHLLADH